MNDKQFAIRLVEMLEAGLATYRSTVPWADRRILEHDGPSPSWLCELAVTKYRPSIIRAVRAFAYSEPFEASPIGEHYRVACLFLRYERREISWATFLSEAGVYTDSVSGELHCEEFYALLNDLEESEYNEALETRQANTIREQFTQHISEVRVDYGQLLKS
jgi:hypothetical protein